MQTILYIVYIKTMQNTHELAKDEAIIGREMIPLSSLTVFPYPLPCLGDYYFHPNLYDVQISYYPYVVISSILRNSRFKSLITQY
jgi:hypothetical protein